MKTKQSISSNPDNINIIIVLTIVLATAIALICCIGSIISRIIHF